MCIIRLVSIYTLNPNEIIGVEERAGSLEVGKDADTVVYSGHPFDYRAVSELVMINGKVNKNQLS